MTQPLRRSLSPERLRPTWGQLGQKVDLSSLHTQDGNPSVLSGQTHSPASQNLKAIAQRDNLRGFDNGTTHMTGTDGQRQNAAAVFNQQTQHHSSGVATANQPDQRRHNAESVLHERAQPSAPARQSIHPSVNPSVNQHPVAAKNSGEQRPAHSNQMGRLILARRRIIASRMASSSIITRKR